MDRWCEIGPVKRKIVELQEGKHLIRASFRNKYRRKELHKVIDVTRNKVSKVLFDFRGEGRVSVR